MTVLRLWCENIKIMISYESKDNPSLIDGK